MKKIDLGQTITILANLGVIAGIGFLAFELNQNNKLLRAQAGYNLLLNRGLWRDDVGSDPEYAEFWLKVEKGGPLSEVEALRLRTIAERTILNWQWEYGQYVDGNFAAGELPIAGYRRVFWGNGSSSEAKATRDAWNRFRSELRPDFVAWMEDNVFNAH